jgi:hypothetical protein
MGFFNLFTPYIQEDWKENIKNFKYRGKDLSLIYNYIGSPVCDDFCNMLPETLA